MDGPNAVRNFVVAYCAVDRVFYSDSIHRGLGHGTVYRVLNYANVDCVVEFYIMTRVVHPVTFDGDVFCLVDVYAMPGPAITTVSNSET